jgi:adenylate kinase family enzyme
MRHTALRIIVVGTSGAGKSTLANALAAQLALLCIEMDTLNWQPGWYDLSQRERRNLPAG